jgi:hypothetical protein
MVLPKGPARTFVASRVPSPLVAREVIEKRRRKLKKLADAIGKSSPPDEYHAARIEAKKLRYAVEFFAPLYGKRAERFVAAVKDLQEVLGDYQDATVAMETLREHARSHRKLGPGTVLAMGAMAEGYRLRAEELRGDFPPAYKGVKGGTWRRLRDQLKKRGEGLDDPRERHPAQGAGKETSSFGGGGGEGVDTDAASG